MGTSKLMLPEMIAVVGREGCGKDSYGGHLEEYGYMHVSAGDVIRERARADGYTDPIPRDILSQTGNRLKAEFGPSPITASTIKRYEEEKELYPAGLVISGFRRAGEVEAFKNYGAVVLWIDASDKMRFKNQSQRARGDQLDMKAFMELSNKEYFGDTTGGSHGVNLQAVEALADCRIINDGTLQDLYDNGDQALAKLA